METVLIFILFWTIFFIVTFVTWVLYIKEPIKIETWSYLDAYPFICHKCMTTWSLIAIYIMSAILLNNIMFGIFGVLISAGYGYGLYKLENERK